MKECPSESFGQPECFSCSLQINSKCSTLEITVDQLHLKDNWKTYIKYSTKPIFLIAMSLTKDSTTDAVT